MSPPAAKSPYAGYRFPAEVISQAVWLYFRFPLSLLYRAVQIQATSTPQLAGSKRL